jgi:hypothetical protein
MTRWLARALVAAVVVVAVWIVVATFASGHPSGSGPFLTGGPTTSGPSR